MMRREEGGWAGPCKVVKRLMFSMGTKEQHRWVAEFEGDAQEMKGRLSWCLQRSW